MAASCPVPWLQQQCLLPLCSLFLTGGMSGAALTCRRQTRLAQLAGADPAAAQKVAELATDRIEAILRNDNHSKSSRTLALQQVGHKGWQRDGWAGVAWGWERGERTDASPA